ncbi:MAG: hypothetical protein ACI4DU_06905 [Lachnospiraceae bacterium]
MKESNEYKKFIKCFGITAGILLLLSAVLVIVIDPFFHYHNVWFGLSPVQVSAEYQVNGALEHLDYDSILLGSSVTANINHSILDDALGTNTIKAAGAGARPSLLYYYMQKGFANQEIKTVYFGLDYYFLTDEFEEDSKQTQILYLRDKNPFNDVNYLWNQDVIFGKIPNMIAQSLLHDYDDGMAYNFAQFSTYGIEEALASHQPDMQVVEQMEPGEYSLSEMRGTISVQDFNANAFSSLAQGENTDAQDFNANAFGPNAQENWMIPQVEENVIINISRIAEVVEAHPETEFKFFFPVTGILWWDRAYQNGDVEILLAQMKYAVAILSSYENVTMYMGVSNRADCIMDLDQYCDLMHASYEINSETAYAIANNETIVTMDNIDEEQDVIRELIYNFEERIQSEGNYDCLYDYTGMFRGAY